MSTKEETVKTVRHWTDRLFSFTTTRHAGFRFITGQFCMVGLPPKDGEKTPLRAYSIACPEHQEELEFLSIKVPNGPLTSKLQKIEPGDKVLIGQKPTGTLTLDYLTPGKRLLLLCSGTGIAPFLGTIRDPRTYENFESIVLVHGARLHREHTHLDLISNLSAARTEEVEMIGARKGQLEYHPLTTRDEGGTKARVPQYLQFLNINAETDRAMICGSMDMIRDTKILLEANGFTEASSHTPANLTIEKAFIP